MLKQKTYLFKQVSFITCNCRASDTEKEDMVFLKEKRKVSIEMVTGIPVTLVGIAGSAKSCDPKLTKLCENSEAMDNVSLNIFHYQSRWLSDNVCDETSFGQKNL
jgi:hypothetical protein